jgi:hypothetical protein
MYDLIGVFDHVGMGIGFVTPVFTDGEKKFVQSIDKRSGKIVRFEMVEVELADLDSVEGYEVTRMIGDEAVYGFVISPSDKLLGDRNQIEDRLLQWAERHPDHRYNRYEIYSMLDREGQAQEMWSLIENDDLWDTRIASGGARATTWHSRECGLGRLYQCPEDLIPRYEEVQHIVDHIRTNLKAFLQLETAVRLLLDGEHVNPVTTIISVPFEGDQDKVYENLGLIIFQQIWGYYLAADPKGTHHGLTNLVFDGNETAMLRRETEKFLRVLPSRNDLAHRVMSGYRMACEMPPFERDVYLKETTSKYLDMHLGVRMYTWGEGTNRVTMFLPIKEGKEAIDRIYYNIEHIIHQNLVAYDETHDHYLPVSEELVLRELENVLVRSRRKGNTRKKIINGLTMNTVLMEDPTMIHHISLADLYYDKLNRIDLLDEAAARSVDMFNTNLIRSTEIAMSVTDVTKLKLEDRVYIDRATAVGSEPVIVTAPRAATTRPAQPAPARQGQQPKKEPVTVATDGLEEL